MGEKAMIDKAIDVLKLELESIKQNGECDCSCEECGLIYKCDELVEVYEWVIDQLEKQKSIIDKINEFTPAETNLLRRYDIYIE
jgi:hypothetical protein